MRVCPALTSPGTCLGVLILLSLLSGCSNTRQDTSLQDTLTVSAGGLDEATARTNAMAAGQQQCLARDGRHASPINMQVTPPAMATMDESPDASTTTDALEAATPEGDGWRATLTLRCH